MNTVEIKPDTLAQIKELARRMDRSVDGLISEALDSYLQDSAEFETQIEQALKEADQEQFVAQDDMKSFWKDLDTIITDAQKAKKE